MQELDATGKVWDILWDALDGGDHDLDALKRTMTDDSDFDTVGIDSLDRTELFLRVQDHFGLPIRREDSASLSSIGGIRAFLKARIAA